MNRIAFFTVAGLFVAGSAFAQSAADTPPTQDVHQNAPGDVKPGTEGAKGANEVITPSGVKCVKDLKCPQNANGCGNTKVSFAFNSAELDDASKAALDCSARCLMSSRDLKVTIEGATDARGSVAYNHLLGQRRADAVATYLTHQGVSNQQLGTLSLGKEHPVCAGQTESCWAQNRRVTIIPAAPVALAP